MKQKKKYIGWAGVAGFWLIFWELSARLVHQPLLFPGPVRTGKALLSMITKKSFYMALFRTYASIGKGYFAALFLGTILGILSAEYGFLRKLLQPLRHILKAVPVAALIILMLLWMPAGKLGAWIAFLVAFSTVWELTGSLGEAYPESGKQFVKLTGLSRYKKWRYYIFPLHEKTYVQTAAFALSTAVKAGVAGEIIGRPNQTIGDRIYSAKVYFETEQVLSWVVVILLTSLLLEALLSAVLGGILRLWMSRLPAGLYGCREYDCEGKLFLKGENVSAGYGEQIIIRKKSFFYEPGEVIWFREPSGAGKTTWFLTLAGLLPEREGELIRSREGCAMAFQEEALCGFLSGVDNFLLLHRLDKKEAVSYLSRFLPKECLNAPVNTYSTGMKKRLEVARTLYSRAPLLLLDEPFAGLDEENRRIIREAMEEKAKTQILLAADHVGK